MLPGFKDWLKVWKTENGDLDPWTWLKRPDRMLQRDKPRTLGGLATRIKLALRDAETGHLSETLMGIEWVSRDADHHRDREMTPTWAKTWQWSVYAVPGSNEGWLVYVDLVRIDPSRPGEAHVEHTPILKVKTLGSCDDALGILEFLTRLLHDND